MNKAASKIILRYVASEFEGSLDYAARKNSYRRTKRLYNRLPWDKKHAFKQQLVAMT